jgi:hypothetical protein
MFYERLQLRQEGRAVCALRALLVAWTLASAPSSFAFEEFDPGSQVPLSELIEIIVLPHTVLAVDATGGGQIEQDLELGETILWQGTRGRVGAVVTNKRLLLVATNSAAWQVARFRQGEQPPAAVLLGDRVALATTAKRALGFDGGSGNLVESSLGPREIVRQSAVGQNVGVILTDRRALGVSPFAGGFFPVRMNLGERTESLVAKANLVTLTTPQRILIFRGPTGDWEERDRNLHD